MCSQVHMGDIQGMPLLRLAASRAAGLGSFSPLGRDTTEELGHWFEAQTLDSLN